MSELFEKSMATLELPRVLELLARETGASPWEINQDGPGSPLLVRGKDDVV